MRAALLFALPATVFLIVSHSEAAPEAAKASRTTSNQSASPGAAPNPAPDSKFGTVGRASGFTWYRFYNREWDYLERPANPNRLYTLGKLEPRREPGLDWCLDSGPACYRGDPASQRAIYEAIFEYEKPHIARIVRHHTGGGAHPPAIRFVIGNEPNFYPYVDPDVYAGIYRKYSEYITLPAPSGLGCAGCRVHAGAILLLDPFSTPSLLGRFMTGSVGAWKGIKRWFGGEPEVPFLPYLDWTSRFLASLDSLGGHADVFDVHLYYVDILVTVLPGGFTPPIFRLQSDPGALERFAGLLRSRGKLRPENPAPSIWVGEFGSVQPFQDAVGVAKVMGDFVGLFEKTPEVEKWFWYTASGRDYKFPNGRLKFWKYDWSFSSAPEVGLFGDSRDAETITKVGEKYRELQLKSLQRK